MTDDGRPTVEVGKTLADFTTDVAARWKAAAAGDDPMPLRKIVFRDWAALVTTLTPKRMDLLRALTAKPADGVRALARELGRDVKRVHSDIVALENIGLVSRDDAGRLSAPVHEVRSTISFASRAM